MIWICFLLSTLAQSFIISYMGDYETGKEEDKTRLISLKEAAEMYGFQPDSLRQLVHSGRLKARKFGHIWSTTPADMEAYLESRKKAGRPRNIDSP